MMTQKMEVEHVLRFKGLVKKTIRQQVVYFRKLKPPYVMWAGERYDVKIINDHRARFVTGDLVVTFNGKKGKSEQVIFTST